MTQGVGNFSMFFAPGASNFLNHSAVSGKLEYLGHIQDRKHYCKFSWDIFVFLACIYYAVVTKKADLGVAAYFWVIERTQIPHK